MGYSKEQRRQYQRAYRARKRAEQAAPPPTPPQDAQDVSGRPNLRVVAPDPSEGAHDAPPPTQPAEHPTVEAAVRAELATLTTATTRPGLAAAALTLARDLDDRTAVPQHPSAAGRLHAILTELRGTTQTGNSAPGKRGRLAALQTWHPSS